jgi:hypothetical protein
MGVKITVASGQSKRTWQSMSDLQQHSLLGGALQKAISQLRPSSKRELASDTGLLKILAYEHAWAWHILECGLDIIWRACE